MKKLSIVVPCYNEEDNIAKLLEAYNETIGPRTDIEVVLVNNGSTDKTATILLESLPTYSDWLTVVTVPKNEGYGHGIWSGLSATTGTYIGWTHGDLQTPPKDVMTALSIIESVTNPERTYVKGSRYGRPLFDRFFSWGMGWFESLYLQASLREINAQPNVFHRNFLTSLEHPPKDFSFDLFVLYMAHREKLHIVRFPVPFLKRQHGTSKWNTGLKAKWKFIKRTILFSIGLKKQLRTYTK